MLSCKEGNLQLGANEFSILLSGEGLWTLNWGSDGTVDDQLWENTEGTGNTEENGVVVGLSQAVVLKEDTRVGINVGVWVLGLSVLGQDAWGNLVNLGDELEHWVFWELLKSERALRNVARIGLTEHSVTVTWNDTAAVEGVPEVLLDVLIRKVISNGLLHLSEPVENLLVGQSVERTSKTLETSRERQEWGGESRADQVSGVGTDVSTFVIGVDDEVESHEVNKVLVLAETELVGEVPCVVLILLDSGDLSILVDVSVDLGSDGWELSDEIHGIIVEVAPVVLLVDTLCVGLSEGRLVLKGGNGKRKLSHWVEGVWAAVEKLLNELWHVRAGSPLSGQALDLSLSWDLTGQEEPEDTFWEWLLTIWALWKELLAFWDSLSTEADTLLGVEDGTLPDKGLDTTGTTVDLVESDLTDNLGSVLLAKLRDLLNFGWDLCSEDLLESLGLSGRVTAEVVEGSGLELSVLSSPQGKAGSWSNHIGGDGACERKRRMVGRVLNSESTLRKKTDGY